MADRKQVNKYYPPDFDPRTGSLDKYHGVHPLRERARKLKTEGILIVRFEMPFNIWCGTDGGPGCKAHIGKGVRYNAEKKCVGSYFSTKIWQFSMKCHLCHNLIVIRTDPQNTTYIVYSGGQRKVETWDEKSNGTYVLPDESHKIRLESDPLYRLEHKSNDVRTAKKSKHIVSELLDVQSRMKTDYEMSKLARKRNRTRRKALKSRLAAGASLGLKGVELLPATDSDRLAAKRVAFKHKQSRHKRLKRVDIATTNVFGAQYDDGGGFVRGKHVKHKRLLAKIVRQGLKRSAVIVSGGSGDGGGSIDAVQQQQQQQGRRKTLVAYSSSSDDDADDVEEPV